MSEEQVEYLWECGKCSNPYPERVIFCPVCAAAEGAENKEAAPADKTGKITEAMMGAIGWSLKNGQIKPAEVLTQAAKRGLVAASVQALRERAVSELDELAASYTTGNRLGATGSGFAAGLPGGLVGFVAIPADVTAVIYFSVRCMSGIGQSYSFETESESGQTLALLAFAHACRLESVVIGHRKLDNLKLARFLWQNPEPYSGLVKACLLKQLASYLALDFAKTSWATFLPIIGGVVNGTTNFLFVGEISKGGKLFYRSLLLGLFPLVAPAAITPQVEKEPLAVTIEVRNIELPLASGKLGAKFVCPSELEENARLIIILWEGEVGQRLAELLAENGFAALLPATPFTEVTRLKELLAYLSESQPRFGPAQLAAGKPGLLAFGDGAALALQVLAEWPDSLTVAVLNSPTGPSYPLNIDVPVLLQWGEADAQFDQEWPNRLRPLSSKGYISAIGYQGNSHSFTDAAASEYNPRIARQVWADSFQWLKSH